MSATKRIGFIGGGFLAQVAHLPAFAQINGVVLAALAEPAPELCSAIAERYPIGRFVANYEDLLADTDLDAFVVAMPREPQECVVEDVLKTGKPVLSEKPMAMTYAKAEHLVDVAHDHNSPWNIGFMRRHDVGFQFFARMVAAARGDAIAMDGLPDAERAAVGKMGALKHVSLSDFCGQYVVPPPPHARRSGPRPRRFETGQLRPEFLTAEQAAAYDYSVNLLTHDIDMLGVVLGFEMKPTRFAANGAKTLRASLLAQDVPVDITVAPSMLGRWDQRIEATFERGRLSLVLPSPLAQQVVGKVIVECGGTTTAITMLDDDRRTAFERQAVHFVEIATGLTASIASASDCLRGMALIDALWRTVVWEG